MASSPENEASGSSHARLLPRGLVCLALGLALLASVPGCGGCRKDPAQAEKDREKKLAEERAKKKEEPKPDFEVDRLMARPTSRLTAGRSEPLGALYKPGHWTAATLEAKANNFDFVGDLEIVVTDGKGEAIPLQGTPFDLTTSSQVTLGKRQRPKPFEAIFFVPPTHPFPAASCRLNWRNGGRRAWQGPNLLSRMPAYQYHLVVIASLPENYAYLKSLASVGPPTDEFGGNPTKPYYNVALIGAEKPDPQRRLPLPPYGLWWTSIACVLWDDAAPDALDQPQQQALLEWLHWGGQLILSGPGTLEKLSGSFLAPYLPATAAPGARQLTQGDFEPLQKWSGKSARSLLPPKDWTGVKLQLHAEAQSMPGSGGLLVERRVGRGRVVVSAFGLSSRALRSWPVTDEILNAFLLRRPPRKFTRAAPVSGRSTGPTTTSASTPAASATSAISAAICARCRRMERTWGSAPICPTSPAVIRIRKKQTGPSPAPWQAPRVLAWPAGTISTPWPIPPEPPCKTPPRSKSPSGVSWSGWWPDTCWCWCRPTGPCFG